MPSLSGVARPIRRLFQPEEQGVQIRKEEVKICSVHRFPSTEYLANWVAKIAQDARVELLVMKLHDTYAVPFIVHQGDEKSRERAIKALRKAEGFPHRDRA